MKIVMKKTILDEIDERMRGIKLECVEKILLTKSEFVRFTNYYVPEAQGLNRYIYCGIPVEEELA